MNYKTFLTIALLAIAPSMYATDETNNGSTRKAINLSQVKCPKPHRLVDSPEAEYDHTTGTLYIYLDASCYSEYSVSLASGSGVDTQQAASPVVTISGDLARHCTYLLIDSEDCGTYAGAVDVSYSGNTY